MKDLRTLNSYRSIEKQRQIGTDTYRRSIYGIFIIPLSSEESAIAIADNGLIDSEWEHVSVSTSTRWLTWEEMGKIKDLFFNEDEMHITIVYTCGNRKLKKFHYLHRT